MTDKSKVLFLIVGMGNKKDPKYPESYLRLLRKAVDSTDAGNIILLPSGSSKENAERIKTEYESSRTVFVQDLPERSMEFDADACYEFFESLFRSRFREGFSAENFIIDFTHGTKAMSAALYAIGMRYRVSDFHYIRRNNDKDGNLIDGETVKNFDASYARGLSVLDQCKTLFKTGQFSAATALLSIEKPKKTLKQTFEHVKMLAGFYSAWDRLDYKTATDIYPEFQTPLFGFDPPSSVKDWVCALAKPVAEADDKNGDVLSEAQKQENFARLEFLLIDLYANALRRIESGLLEDASIRLYRIAEMIGQACLYKKGYVSNRMPDADDRVKYFARNNQIHLREGYDFYEFGRKKAAEFLKKISDKDSNIYSIADFLEKNNALIESIRNKSVLIHGFSAKALPNERLKELADSLLSQIRLLYGRNNIDTNLTTALFMNNFKDKK